MEKEGKRRGKAAAAAVFAIHHLITATTPRRIDRCYVCAIISFSAAAAAVATAAKQINKQTKSIEKKKKGKKKKKKMKWNQTGKK